MSNEKFIKPREQKSDGSHHNHDGRHANTTRLDSIMARLNEWRNQRTAANESGHRPVNESGNPYLPEGEGTEIVLFDPKVYNRTIDFEDPRLDD